MFNIKKNIKKIAVISLFLVIVFDVIYFKSKVDDSLNEECSTTFVYKNNRAGLAMPVNGTLILKSNATGLIELSGIVSLRGSPHRLARVISFDYERENASVFKLTDMMLEKHSGDDLDNDFLDANFFSMKNEPSRHMILTKVDNAFIIGNLHSPVFMCVIKK